MLRKIILTGAGILALTLAACSSPEEREAEASNVVASSDRSDTVKIEGLGEYTCVHASKVNIPHVYDELKGEYRRMLLTPAADRARVRVNISTRSDNQYGTVVIVYSDPSQSCVLWTESLTLQEYSVRFGMNPAGISPFYETVDETNTAPQ